jgi:predicted permease
MAARERHHGALLSSAARVVMRTLRREWKRLLGSFSGESSDLATELQSHIEMQTDDNVRAGMPLEEARRQAKLKFGGLDSTKESFRDQRGLPWLETTLADLRYAARSLRKSPGFTTVAVLTLAIGIGATTAVFSVVNGVLIKALPYPDPDALVGVWHSALIQGATFRNANHSASMYVTYLDNNRTFQEFGVWNNGASSVTGIGEPEEVRTFRVTNGVLRAFGIQPDMGRWFSEADDSSGAPETVILMHGYWQRRFGGDPRILGRAVTIDSRPRYVIGVMPRTFKLNGNPEIILPLQFDRAQLPLTFAYSGIARLKPGVSVAQANADLERMIPIWIEQFKMQRFASLGLGAAIRPFKEDVVGDIANVLWVLMGTIAIVLLVACANVANLMLVRADGRQQELAIRAALGAGRGRIARELLVGTFILGALGGAAGLALAYAALHILIAIGPANLPRLSEITMDAPVMAFAVAISLSSSLFFGLMPILKFTKPRIATVLRGGERTASQGRERHRSQNALVVVQVALALVLLVGSGLMIRSFRMLRGVQPGFLQPDRIQTMRIAIPPAQVADSEAVTRMQKAILDKLAAVPGVASAGFIDGLPMDLGTQSSSPVSVEGQPDSGALPPVRRVKFVSPNLLQTLGIPLRAGRDFTWNEIYGRNEVALVSENFAKLNWGDAHAALGKRIREGTGGSWREVIGVTGDVYDSGTSQPPPPIVFWPARVQFVSMGVAGYVPRSVAFAIRSDRTGTESFLKQLQEAAWSVNPNLPVAEVQTLSDIYEQSMRQTSFTLVMLAIAGSVALMLGIIGIYGVLSYAVSRREREIGIRLALGARRSAVEAMFVKRGLMLASTGVGIGLIAAAGLTRLLSSLLFGIGPLDPLTYAAVPLVLMSAAAAASYLPARRAVRVDPAITLRHE